MKSELEKCLAGEPFFGGDPEIAEIAAKAKRLTRELNDTAYTDVDKKRDIMRQLFGRVGRRVHIDVDFHCEYGRHILIGDRVIINMNCTFVDNNIIEIGNDVLIPQTCRFTPPRTPPATPNECCPTTALTAASFALHTQSQ